MRSDYLCGKEDEGRSLYSILRRELALSLHQVRRLKPAGGIFLNHEPAHTDYRVREGDRVEIRLPSLEREALLQPQEGPLDVLWESEGLLVVNKAPGILVHPTKAQITDTLANYVLGYLRKSDPQAACHAVNRLDRDTSGAVLFAKSARMKHLAAAALQREDAEKAYLALVHGRMDPSSGEIDLPLRREAPEAQRRIPAPDGQPARTHYETLAVREEYSLLRLRLYTGRTHQIRAHCLALGHPVLGDRLYYTPASRELSQTLGLESQALHAYYLHFHEPRSGEEASIFAPVHREPMAALLRQLSFSPESLRAVPEPKP